MLIALWGHITSPVWTFNTVHTLHQSAPPPSQSGGGYIGLVHMTGPLVVKDTAQRP